MHGRSQTLEATLRLYRRQQTKWHALYWRYVQPAATHETMIAAITREKQIKAGSRAKKLALIEALNPD